MNTLRQLVRLIAFTIVTLPDQIVIGLSNATIALDRFSGSTTPARVHDRLIRARANVYAAELHWLTFGDER